MRVTLHNCQAEYEKTLYRKTLRNRYCYMLDRMVLFLGKDKDPQDVFRSDVEQLRAWLRDKWGVKGWSSQSQYMQVGKSFYNWLDIYEYVPVGFNPFRAYVNKRGKRSLIVKDAFE